MYNGFTRVVFTFSILLLMFVSDGQSQNQAVQNSQSVSMQANILFVIADDWSYPHAGIYGDKVIKTPNFDRVAREGVLFTNSYCAAPSCSPSRAAILTGQYPHRLEEGGTLWGFLPGKFPNYTRILKDKGYHVGMTRKGWGPGDYKAGGYEQNPAGQAYKDFAAFFAARPQNKPFCFWFGTTDPHRDYEKGSGEKSGMNPGNVKVPGYWPDVKEVRSDILDYYFEVERMDRELGEMLALLEKAGMLDNTMVVVTSDNGMPFPRAKANLYDAGTRMPLAIRWKARAKGGQQIDAFVSHVDFAPTFLEAAGVAIPEQMQGQSLMPLLTGKTRTTGRDKIFFERERHANVRKGDLSYPSRAVRTKDFLYIRNFEPSRWPAGDPQLYHSVGPYGDVDDSPTKQFILQNKDKKEMVKYFTLAFAKRPAEELYDLKNDPDQLSNLAGQAKYAKTLASMQESLVTWMSTTGDPRATNPTDSRWERVPYYGPPAKVEKNNQVSQ